MKTLSRKDQMYEQIKQHGENLNAIFNTGIEPIALCKKLLRIERKASHVSTCLCNTNTMHLLELNRFTGYDVKQSSEDDQDKFFDGIRKQVVKVLGKQAEDVFFINHDPRGYALKLKSEFCEGKNIHKDWGGYGILAPDFNN